MTENTATMPIVTLKAEKVTDFTFTPEYKARRYGRSYSDEIASPYRSDYEAKVGVKVGNTVKELTLYKKSRYISSYNDANGEWHSGFDLEGFDIKVERGDTHPFAELENAGIAIDWMEVLNEYQKAVEHAEYRMTLHNRYKEWEAIRANKKEYAASWMHGVKAELEADPNKRIKAALLQTTFSKTTLASFLEHPNHAITVTYKGVTGYFHREGQAGSYSFSGDSVYQIPEDYDKEKHNLYNFKFGISEGKTRRAKRLGTLYLKFVDDVNYELEARKRRAEMKKSEAEKRQEKKERLEKITGYPVVILKTEKSRHDHRGHYVGRYTYTFVILIEQPTSRYDDPKYISIDEYINTEYKDGKSVEIGRTYSVKTLRGLTADQFKRILDIVMEGKTALTKLERPE